MDNLKQELSKTLIINKALTEKLAGYMTEPTDPNPTTSAKKFKSISDIIIEDDHIEKPSISHEASITKYNSPIRSNIFTSVK